MGTKNSPPVATEQSFPVIGIGASAGGLDAFKRLLKAIPENPGMAYVLVQHLDPSHESLLPQILSKQTKLPVHEITNDIKLTPGHIYIIPENKILTSNDGVLKLSVRDVKIKNFPIDVFFRTLAEVHQEFAVGVVLSGTGTDGTLGLQAIKEYGGITFAQNQQSAAYDGMPLNAINAGVVDFILSPEEIPLQLSKMQQPFESNKSIAAEVHSSKNEEDAFKQIIVLLRQRSGVDFIYYKQPTIYRRIARRMAFCKTENITDYQKLLQSDKAELDALFQDLLIPVTSFFRDPKIFGELSNTILPALLKNSDNKPLRLWIAGCSTGEEAFSIAICLHENLTKKHSEKKGLRQIQIFGTDISERVIKKAREGNYSKEAMQTVSDERQKNYFTKTETGYQVNKNIRDLCIFAVHNFLKDPPFANMDLISCRNVLIYMEPFLQKKVLTTFHYALKAKGFLLLGKSETTGLASELFSPFVKNNKIYTPKPLPRRFFTAASERKEEALTAKNHSAENAGIVSKQEAMQTDFRKSANEVLLSKHTPAGVVVNEQLDIVHFHGATSLFIEPSPGKPSFNLLKMAREGLAFELRNALHKSRQNKAPTIKEAIPVTINGTQHMVTIEIIPLVHTVEPHWLILFNKTLISSPLKNGVKTGVISKQKAESLLRIQQLENELVQCREDMRSITEDQEAANEELQSTNEELLSANEELQSLNEELETSKEELQSTNEELLVVNQELLDKQDQLNASRLYSEAIVATMREPLIVLDKALRIKTANTSFYKKFNLTAQQTEGMLLYELQNRRWDNHLLRSLLEEILPQKNKFEGFEITLDFPSSGECTMLLNALQILNEKDKEPLILLAIEDITDRKTAEIKLLNANDELEIKNKKIEKHAEELEQKVNDRTGELKSSQMNLEDSVKQLFNKNKNLEQLIINEFSESFSAYKTGDEFFNSLVQDLTDKTKLDYVFMGELVKTGGEEYAIQSFALNAFGKPATNIFYSLPHSPFDQLIQGAFYSSPEQCRVLFPNNETIKEYNVEEYIGYPLFDIKGRVIGLIAVMHQKKIDDASYVESLLKIAAKRTEGELERIRNENLLAANNIELGKQNAELASFSYIASHDLQEPLRKILTFSNRLQVKAKDSLSEEAKTYLGKIDVASVRMTSLIKDLLNYTRITNKEELFELTDLNETLTDILLDFELLIEEKKAIIKSEPLPTIEAIPMQMNQLFCNLIGNALKFSKAGVSPVINIFSRMLSIEEIKEYADLNQKSSYCEIIFKDEGIGFDQQYAEKIFIIFQRLSQPGLFTGTGIGLAICKKITDQHHGKIFAISKENVVAAFHVILPVKQAR